MAESETTKVHQNHKDQDQQADSSSSKMSSGYHSGESPRKDCKIGVSCDSVFQVLAEPDSPPRKPRKASRDLPRALQ